MHNSSLRRDLLLNSVRVFIEDNFRLAFLFHDDGADDCVLGHCSSARDASQSKISGDHLNSRGTEIHDVIQLPRFRGSQSSRDRGIIQVVEFQSDRVGVDVEHNRECYHPQCVQPSGLCDKRDDEVKEAAGRGFLRRRR